MADGQTAPVMEDRAEALFGFFQDAHFEWLQRPSPENRLKRCKAMAAYLAEVDESPEARRAYGHVVEMLGKLVPTCPVSGVFPEGVPTHMLEG